MLSKTIFLSLPICVLAMTIVKSTLPVSAYSQFVPNPGFELPESGFTFPSNIGQTIRLGSWYSPNGASPDWFHENATNTNAGVPMNFMGTQYGAPDATRDSSAGYVGIAVDRNGLGPTHWHEYIQAKLLTPLTIGNRYKVSFKWSRGDVRKYSFRRLGAYLSTGPLTQSGIGALNAQPQVVSDEDLWQTHAPDNVQWEEIKGEITASEAFEYITIGNFQNSIPLADITPHDTVPPNSTTVVTTYYYIDNVEIEDITPKPLTCNFTTTIARIDGQGDECCYRVTITSHDINTYPVSDVLVTPQSSGAAFTHTFNPPLIGLESKSFDFCLSSEFTSQQLLISLLGTTCDDVPLLAQCSGHCDVVEDYGFALSLERAENNGENCCWDIIVTNTTDYDIRINGISAYADVGNPLYGHIISESIDWFKKEIQQGTRILWQQEDGPQDDSEEASLIPNNSVLRIGKICLPASEGLSGPIDLQVAVGGGPICWRTFPHDIECFSDPQDCCNDANLLTQWKYRSGGTPPAHWVTFSFIELYIMQVVTPGCAIYGFNVYDDDTGELLMNIPITPNTPLLFDDSDRVWGSFYIEDCKSLTLRVEYFDEQGNVICTKVLPTALGNPCPGEGDKQSLGQDDKIFVGDDVHILRIAPNPSNEFLNVSFTLSRSSAVSIQILSIKGIKFAEYSLGELSAGKVEYTLNANTLLNGVYILKLIGEDGVASKIFTVIK